MALRGEIYGNQESPDEQISNTKFISTPSRSTNKQVVIVVERSFFFFALWRVYFSRKHRQPDGRVAP